MTKRTLHGPRAIGLLSAIAAGMFVAIATLGYIATRETDDPGLENAPTLAAGDTAVAYVNGVPIGQTALDATVPQLEFIPEGVEPPPSDRGTLLNNLINDELVRQEALRRGITVEDAEVVVLVREQQRGLQAEIASGELPENVRLLLDQLAAAGHPLDGWHENETLLDSYRTLLLNNKVLNDYAGRLRSDPNAAGRLIAELRTKARIELVPQ